MVPEASFCVQKMQNEVRDDLAHVPPVTSVTRIMCPEPCADRQALDVGTDGVLCGKVVQRRRHTHHHKDESGIRRIVERQRGDHDRTKVHVGPPQLT